MHNAPPQGGVLCILSQNVAGRMRSRLPADGVRLIKPTPTDQVGVVIFKSFFKFQFSDLLFRRLVGNAYMHSEEKMLFNKIGWQRSRFCSERIYPFPTVVIEE
jgi:hypothetical protein